MCVSSFVCVFAVNLAAWCWGYRVEKVLSELFYLSVCSCKVVAKVRDDKHSRAAGGALFIDSSYSPGS